jgi:hypothetical protein
VPVVLAAAAAAEDDLPRLGCFLFLGGAMVAK